MVKWSQPPQVFVPPGAANGWDVKSVYGSNQIVADDWVCTSKLPVTDIRWWGSFLGWDYEYPPALPQGFMFTIWTDVPAGPLHYSHPGKVLWQAYADSSNYTWRFAGWDFDPNSPLQPPEAKFEFDTDLPETMWFFQDPDQNVYWISIAAVYGTGQYPHPFGWETRPHLKNPDDAVIITFPTAPVIGQGYESGSPIEDRSGNSWDMSFELTTRYSAISGEKFHDKDGDHGYDAGEKGLSDWTVFLDTEGDGTLDPGETSTVTDANGNYAFLGLLPGNYTVAEVVKDHWAEASPWPGGSYAAVLGPAQTIGGRDFGNCILGDADGNLIVDMADYVDWFDGYGGAGPWIKGDFNWGGLVDMADYVIWFTHYGFDASSAALAAPEVAAQSLEPATAAVAGPVALAPEADTAIVDLMDSSPPPLVSADPAGSDSTRRQVPRGKTAELATAGIESFDRPAGTSDDGLGALPPPARVMPASRQTWNAPVRRRPALRYAPTYVSGGTYDDNLDMTDLLAGAAALRAKPLN